ncbi:hypothetical protein HDE76_003768 [Rhodanobacter sp. ANJX3]|uniref:hypothetical protein n=1 Tax=unclassified Rhodanobacter TaxID=2621553 RepID=UPI0015C97F18|nr:MULTISPECIES: hypothetical protein [unclassified Rhodanobacter]MBB5360524.1 hypothetical protein [Rhodanobacter sp. ANJX3]NYE30276.1 hypothetical protein [Rhodanobacter sp. K2T2]
MSELNVETEMSSTIRPLARLSATAFGEEWADPSRGHFLTMITMTASIHSPADGGLDYDPS